MAVTELMTDLKYGISAFIITLEKYFRAGPGQVFMRKVLVYQVSVCEQVTLNPGAYKPPPLKI